MLQDVSRHVSTELSEVAEEEYPRNPVGLERFDAIRDYRRNRRVRDQVKTCIPFVIGPKGNLRNRFTLPVTS